MQRYSEESNEDSNLSEIKSLRVLTDKNNITLESRNDIFDKEGMLSPGSFVAVSPPPNDHFPFFTQDIKEECWDYDANDENIYQSSISDGYTKMMPELLTCNNPDTETQDALQSSIVLDYKNITSSVSRTSISPAASYTHNVYKEKPSVGAKVKRFRKSDGYFNSASCQDSILRSDNHETSDLKEWKRYHKSLSSEELVKSIDDPEQPCLRQRGRENSTEKNGCKNQADHAGDFYSSDLHLCESNAGGISECTAASIQHGNTFGCSATGDLYTTSYDNGYCSNDFENDESFRDESKIFNPAECTDLFKKKNMKILHQLCRSATSPSDLRALEDLINVDTASGIDTIHGKTALHWLSQNAEIAKHVFFPNQNLIETTMSLQTRTWNSENEDTVGTVPTKRTALTTCLTGRSDASSNQFLSHPEHNNDVKLEIFVVGVLWYAYPAAMMTPDCQGYIPFECALREWVEGAFEDYKSQYSKNQTIIESQRRSSFWVAGPPAYSLKVASRLGNWWSPHTKNELKLNASVLSEDDWIESGQSLKWKNTDTHARDRIFPTEVQVSANAWYALTMLSSMLDQMDISIKARRTICISPEGRETIQSKIQPKNLLPRRKKISQLEAMTMEDLRNIVIQTISSIPQLVKTILLIDDEKLRQRCLMTSIMRHVLASKYSVGSWLTGMLQSRDKQVSDRAIEYLHLISCEFFSTSSCDSPGYMITAHNEKCKKSLNVSIDDRNEFYNKVSLLSDFIPSILSLEEKQIEEVSTTTVVMHVLDRIISRPFSVTVVFSDGIFLALLLIGFTNIANGLLLGSSVATVYAYIYVANAGLFYFVIREIGKAISLCMITRGSRLYFWSFWNVTDLLCTVMSLISTVLVRSYLSTPSESNYVSYNVSSEFRSFLAVTTAFQWLRVLNFLKGINMQLATFILAIVQITKDVLWFCVILFTLVISFGQMFFILLVPTSCQVDESFNQKECTQSEYYLKAYAILLGGFGLFERKDFESTFSLVLAVVFTFMVVIILLNVLIAIASDSYEKCLIRSHNLFGRARVMMLAELVSFQNLLRRTKRIHSGSSTSLNTGNPEDLHHNSWWSSDACAKGWSRGSVLFFILSLLITIVWAASEVIGYLIGEHQGEIWTSLFSILVNVLLYVCMLVFLANGAVAARTTDNSRSSMHREGWYYLYFQNTMIRILGSSVSKTKNDKDDYETNWQGRTMFLKRQIEQITKSSNLQYMAKIKSLEDLLIQNEAKIESKLVVLEKDFAALRSDIFDKFTCRSQSEERGTNSDQKIYRSMTEIVEKISSPEQQFQNVRCKNDDTTMDN